MTNTPKPAILYSPMEKAVAKVTIISLQARWAYLKRINDELRQKKRFPFANNESINNAYEMELLEAQIYALCEIRGEEPLTFLKS